MKLCFNFGRRRLQHSYSDKPDVSTNQSLKQLSERLRDARAERQFVLGSLQYVTWVITGRSLDEGVLEALPSADTGAQPRKNSDPGHQEAILKAQIQEVQPIAVDTPIIRALNRYLLSQPVSFTTMEADPEILFRIFTPNSNTTHDELLGFRCSNTAHCPPDLKAKTLMECSSLDSKTFISHCEKSEPSEFISLSESPARLMNFIHGKWHLDLPDEVRIAVIKVETLRKLRVRFARTTEIEKHLGLRRIMFVTHSHWLAHRWIPSEAVVGLLTLGNFREACHITGITSRCGLADSFPPTLKLTPRQQRDYQRKVPIGCKTDTGRSISHQGA